MSIAGSYRQRPRLRTGPAPSRERHPRPVASVRSRYAVRRRPPRPDRRGFPQHCTGELGLLRFATPRSGRLQAVPIGRCSRPAEGFGETSADHTSVAPQKGYLLPGTGDSRYCPFEWPGGTPRSTNSKCHRCTLSLAPTPSRPACCIQRVTSAPWKKLNPGYHHPGTCRGPASPGPKDPSQSCRRGFTYKNKHYSSAGVLSDSYR